MMEEESRALTYAEMREQNLFTDAVIKSSSGREWRVHKVVMSSSGRFFSTAFSYPSFTGTLDLAVRDHVVQAIVDSAYEGGCDVNAENALEVLSGAFMYQLEALVKTCIAFAVDNMMTPEHVIALKVFARIHREGFKTFEEARDFIDILDRFIRRNFINIYESSDIHELSFNEIEAIVKEDDLNIPEDELLDFVLEYVSFHHLDTEKAMELLRNVRLDFIDSAKISQVSKENQILGNEIERRKIVNVRFEPRFPRDIIIARHASTDFLEIFNVRKNEWKPIEMDEVMHDILYYRSVLVDNIIYKIQVNSIEPSIKVRGFDLASGQFLEEKKSEFPYEIGYLYPHFKFVAWNGGIVFSLQMRSNSNGPSSVAYYKPGENRWQLLPPTKKHAEYVVVDGILFSMGGIGQDNEQALFNVEGANANENEDQDDMSKEIRYYDPKTSVWVLCGVFKKKAHVKAVVVDGKVYAFSMYNEYGECFEPVLTDGTMTLKWFPEVKIPFKKENCQMVVVDNKIIFIGGFQHAEDDNDDMECGWRKECHVFSPRTREWSRVSNLSVSTSYMINMTEYEYEYGEEAIKIDTSKLEVARIEEICNGQLVVPND